MPEAIFTRLVCISCNLTTPVGRIPLVTPVNSTNTTTSQIVAVLALIASMPAAIVMNLLCISYQQSSSQQ
jgi:hypothetical protein